MLQIQKVCVAGAGNMGRQIALNAALAGFQVNVKTYFQEEEEAAVNWVETFLSKGVSKGKYTKEQKEQAISRLHYMRGLELAVQGVDLIIESILENLETKQEFFKQVNDLVDETTLLVTNSSYIPSSKFIECVTNPSRLANFHYFNPVAYMKLVEIVRGEHTSDETIEALKVFAEKLGKRYVLVNREIEGFVVNRLLRAVQDEAYSLYGNGIASFEDIDIAAELGLNYPMGPFRLVDFTGIDINYYNRKKKFEETGKEEDRPPSFLVEKFEKGEFGRKTGRGWYDYEK